MRMKADEGKYCKKGQILRRQLTKENMRMKADEGKYCKKGKY
jgi:hypothetical protein